MRSSALLSSIFAIAVLAAGKTISGQTVAMASNPLPRIGANDNRAPAGRESRGVLRLHLEARLGRWYPQADNGPSEPMEAFAEEGHRPLVPGPLVRVHTGTRIAPALVSSSLHVCRRRIATRPSRSRLTIRPSPGNDSRAAAVKA